MNSPSLNQPGTQGPALTSHVTVAENALHSHSGGINGHRYVANLVRQHLESAGVAHAQRHHLALAAHADFTVSFGATTF